MPNEFLAILKKSSILDLICLKFSQLTINFLKWLTIFIHNLNLYFLAENASNGGLKLEKIPSKLVFSLDK